MAEYKYVDWSGLQYYHGKVTELIDSRLRQCIRFGEETLYVDLQSPDTNDLNIVIRVIDSFTVRPSDKWFDETLWNNTYPAGTLLQVVQKSSGVVYTVFLQPTSNSGGGGSTPEVDLSNYYTKDEVDAKILEALSPYATVEFVTARLDVIQELLDTQIDNFGRLTNRIASLEETISTKVEPAITQLEAAVTKIAEEKADKSDIPSLEGYATESFVAAKIAEAELAGGDVDLSAYYTKDETYSKDEVNSLIPDVSDVARKSDLEGLATEQFVATVVGAIEIPEVPTKVGQLENDAGYITAADVSVKDTYLYTIGTPTSAPVRGAVGLTPELVEFVDRYIANEPVNLYVTYYGTTFPTIVKYQTYTDGSNPSFRIEFSRVRGSFGYSDGVSNGEGACVEDYFITISRNDDNTSWSSAYFGNCGDTYLPEHKTVLQMIDEAIDNIKIPETDLSNYYNKTEVENIVEEAVGNIKVPDVPTNVSAFVNDAGYVTEKDLPDFNEYAKISDIPDTDNFATQDFVKQKIAEAQLSGGDVDLSVFYTKEEIDAKGFATEEYVQSIMDDADVVGMDTRITQLENQSNSVDTRLNEIEDQADENSASLTALDGEIDRIDATILTMDTQIVKISQNIADLQAYGTF